MRKLTSFLIGLLLMISSLLNAQAPVANFSALVDSSCGLTLTNSFRDYSLNATSWKWYFQGATPDTSTLRNPINIQYNGYGCYSVKLVVSNKNGSDSLTKNNYVCLDSMPKIIIKGTFNICMGGYTTDTIIINGDTTYITGIVTKTYTIVIRNGACFKDTSLTIHVDTMPTFVFKADTFLCQGQSTTIYAYNPRAYRYKYLWNTGSTADSLVTGPLYTTQTYYVTISKGGCSRDSSAITIKVHDCTGIENYTNALGISIFPDPVSTRLFVQSGSPLDKNSILTITDMTGRKVYNAPIGILVPNQLEIDVSSFAHAVYFLQLQTSQGTAVTKFVKE